MRKDGNRRRDDAPELIEICLNCDSEGCDGLCERYCEAYKRIVGKRLRMGPNEKREKRRYELRGMIEWNGEAHTLQKWAQISGVPYPTLYKRLYYRKMEFGEAISTAKCKPDTVNKITVDGVTMTVYEWAAALGVPACRIYRRMGLGYSPEEAVRLSEMKRGRPKKGKGLVENG